MRAIMSPMGSFTDMRPSSPARLQKAGDEPLGPEVPQRDTAQAMLAEIAVRAPGQFAPIVDACRRRIARQLGQPESRGEAFLHRQLLVARDRLELRAATGELLRHLAPPVVLLDRTLLRHTYRS